MLNDKQLHLARTLPVKMNEVTLRGRFIQLKPLNIERDGTNLFEVSNGEQIDHGEKIQPPYDSDALIWQFMGSGPFEHQDHFLQYLHSLLHDTAGAVFSVFDCRLNKPIGIATYMNNFPQHLKIELGNIWYSPIAQGTAANSEATYLMLEHAFRLGYRRVEWKCNALNSRSRKAALRIGFKFEGIQEYHMIVKGKNRDTAWFRILDTEWDTIKNRLEESLYANPL